MKKIISALIMAVMVFGIFAFTATPAKVYADSLYVKKIVSVVYDDSGSMLYNQTFGFTTYDNKNWAYANYAMQAFCGLLNSEDQLYITYMSDRSNAKKIDLNNVESSIKTIREHSVSASVGTPYGAVQTAKNVLRNANDTDENTQYWLVIITDGEFGSGVPSNGLSGDISSFAEEKMANGTKPQVTYLAIGDKAEKLNISKNNIFEFHTNGADDIINAMANIANKVSGRSRVSSADVKLLNSKTVQITSAVPLLNIAVLSQKSSAKVKGASYLNGDIDLEINRSVSFTYPRATGFVTDTSLIGGGFLISSSNSNIDAGTYVIEFDSEVTLDNFVIMFEPALEVRATVTVNGKAITDLSEYNSLHEKDKLSVSYKVYEYGTNNEINVGLLPEGTVCEITISENGNVVRSANGNNMSIDNYELTTAKTEISAKVSMEDFSPIEFYVEFTPQKYVEPPKKDYTVKAEFGSSTKQIHLGDIGKNHGVSIIYSVYLNGERMTNTDEVKALNPQFSVSPSGNDGEVTYTSDGKIIFTPNKASGKTSGGGTYNVTVTCTVMGATASETYEIIVPDYTVKAEFGSSTKQIHLGDIGKNHGVSIIYSVYLNGERMTDTEAVKALNPQFSVSPSGNDGEVTYTSDGKIVFTPNKASGRTSGGGTYGVTVACTVMGATASETYEIIVPDYAIIAVEPETPIVKTEFFGNTTSVSFYVIKDGAKLSKAELGEIFASLNKKYSHLQLSIEVMDDGTVVCTPYDEDEYKLNFFTWLFNNGIRYIFLEGRDAEVTFTCDYGSVTAVMPVCGASAKYIWLNVVAPIVTLVGIIAFLVWWICCILFKPKFPKGMAIYSANIQYSTSNEDHLLNGWSVERLEKHNTIGYLLIPTMKPKTVEINGLKFTATYGGIKCEEDFPWYTGKIRPVNASEKALPEVIGGERADDYFGSKENLHIKEIAMTDVIQDGNPEFSTPDDSKFYLIPIDFKTVSDKWGNNRKVIKQGTIFYYVSKPY